MHKGLPAENRARLAADRIVPAVLGDREPHVDIGGDGYILPRAVAHGLTIQTVNVRKVRIHALRVLTEIGIWGYALRNLLAEAATIAWSGTMTVPEDHNRTVETAIPVHTVIKPGSVGAFLVVAEDDAHGVDEKAWKNLNDEGPPTDRGFSRARRRIG